MITNSNEYMEFLRQIQESGTTTFSSLPSEEPRFLIDANKRSITIPSEFSFLAVRYDHQAETVYFEIDRYFDNVDLSQHTCIVQFINKDEYGNVSDGHYRVPIMDITTIDGKIIFGWTIENPATKYAGDIEFSVRFYTITGEGDEARFLYNINTVPSKSTILDTLQVHGGEYSHPSEFEIWVAKITEIVNDIEQAEENLAERIRETEQYLEDTINSTTGEVAALLELAKQQVEFAKLQSSIASEKVALAREQVTIAAEKAHFAEVQANIASQQAAEATSQSAIAKNYSDIAGRYANEAQQAKNEFEDLIDDVENMRENDRNTSAEQWVFTLKSGVTVEKAVCVR